MPAISVPPPTATVTPYGVFAANPLSMWRSLKRQHYPSAAHVALDEVLQRVHLPRRDWHRIASGDEASVLGAALRELNRAAEKRDFLVDQAMTAVLRLALLGSKPCRDVLVHAIAKKLAPNDARPVLLSWDVESLQVSAYSVPTARDWELLPPRKSSLCLPAIAKRGHLRLVFDSNRQSPRHSGESAR